MSALRQEEADERLDRVAEIFAIHDAEIADMFQRARARPMRAAALPAKRQRYSKRGEVESAGERPLVPRLEALFIPNREPRIDWGIEFGSLQLMDGLHVRRVRLMPERPPNAQTRCGSSIEWTVNQGGPGFNYLEHLELLDIIRGRAKQPPSDFHIAGIGRGIRPTRFVWQPTPGPATERRESWIELTPKPQGGSAGSMWPVAWRGYRPLGGWTHLQSDAHLGPPCGIGSCEDKPASQRLIQRDRGELRDLALEEWCRQLWSTCRRRRHATDGTEDIPPVKGRPFAGAVESFQNLVLPRRNKTAGNPRSTSIHIGNEIALDNVADINRRGMHDPRTCLRSSWPYGPPADLADDEIRLAAAIVDSYHATRPDRFWRHPSLQTSSSTSWRRPIEIEETRRLDPNLASNLWLVLANVGLSQYYRPLDLTRMWRRVSNLTDTQIDVLLMKEHVGMTETEIAHQLRIARSGAHKHLVRGRRNVARFMWVAILLVVEGLQSENKLLEVS